MAIFKCTIGGEEEKIPVVSLIRCGEEENTDEIIDVSGRSIHQVVLPLVLFVLICLCLLILRFGFNSLR